MGYASLLLSQVVLLQNVASKYDGHAVVLGPLPRQVLHANVDTSDDTEVFHAIRVYMEARGQFFNYLKSEEDGIVGLQRSCTSSDELNLIAISQKIPPPFLSVAIFRQGMKSRHKLLEL